MSVSVSEISPNIGQSAVSATVVAGTVPVAEPRALPVPKNELSAASILVIEDDKILARMLLHLLDRRGFNVRHAPNGKAAIEEVETGAPPDLILLDLLLPFFDGFEILNRIKETPSWQNVPVIILTSKTQEFSVVRAFEAGAMDYVTKPFHVEELMLRVRRFLR
jgi:DNA-binding response OmpR family regulator